jgi:hypothetical protein
MTEITFQKAWFTAVTTCSICLLHYQKKPPVKLHDDTALHSHLDGAVHRTAVNQLLIKHGTHAKIKATALNAKTPKGVKVNLPINNNNFWKYALLQQPTQLSAPSTSTPPPASANTTTTAATTTTKSRKRQRTSEEPTQLSSSSSSTNSEVVTYTLLKQQQQLDEHSKQLLDIHTLLSSIDAMLANTSASSSYTQMAFDASTPALHMAQGLPMEDNAHDSDDSVESGLDEYGNDDELIDGAESSTAPQRAASAPATRSRNDKRKDKARGNNSSSSSKNSRAH